MVRYFKFFLIISIIILIYFSYQIKMKDSTTMKYFPLDENLSILDAMTKLSYDKQQDHINWISRSSSSEPTYLRQDVALIYENGIFKGLQSKWKTDKATIELNNTIPIKTSTVLQAISFHHGEIHHEDDSITSIQKMTNDSLYITKKMDDYYAFHQPETKEDKLTQKRIVSSMDENLDAHLQTMLTYHELSAEEYNILPLSELIVYDNSPLFEFSNETTSRIIGQFWEGFYNEYITLLMSYKDDIPSHYMPFILLSKDKSHLLVLFELDQKQYKLIQHISVN